MKIQKVRQVVEIFISHCFAALTTGEKGCGLDKVNYLFRREIIFSAWFVVILFSSPIIIFNFFVNVVIDRNVWPSFLIMILLFFIWLAFVKFIPIGIFGLWKFAPFLIFFGMLMMVILPKIFIRDIQQFLGYVNFYPLRDRYSQEVTKVGKTGAPRFIRFELSGFEKTLLIFDEADELGDKHRIKSKDWWMRARKSEGELATCSWNAAKVAQHFYRVEFHCEYPYDGENISEN